MTQGFLFYTIFFGTYPEMLSPWLLQVMPCFVWKLVRGKKGTNFICFRIVFEFMWNLILAAPLTVCMHLVKPLGCFYLEFYIHLPSCSGFSAKGLAYVNPFYYHNYCYDEVPIIALLLQMRWCLWEVQWAWIWTQRGLHSLLLSTILSHCGKVPCRPLSLMSGKHVSTQIIVKKIVYWIDRIEICILKQCFSKCCLWAMHISILNLTLHPLNQKCKDWGTEMFMAILWPMF